MRKRELQGKCQRLETQVRERGLATEAELAEYRPKPRDFKAERAAARARQAEVRRRADLGERLPPIPPDPDRADDFQWIYWYAQLVRFCGRLETRDLATAEADGLVVAALRADPREVRLLDTTTVLSVYPKSFEALLNVHARDQLISWLVARYAVCRQTANGPEVMDLLERLAAELAYQQQLMVWTATTAGHGLPFTIDDARPEPPEQIRALGPWDIVRMHQAFFDVNATRLQALEKLIRPSRDDAGGGRPSWSVFIGSMALKWRIDPVKLMRDHALIQLLAMVKIAALAGAGADVEEEVEA
jgi:hypothetical protein